MEHCGSQIKAFVNLGYLFLFGVGLFYHVRNLEELGQVQNVIGDELSSEGGSAFQEGCGFEYISGRLTGEAIEVIVVGVETTAGGMVVVLVCGSIRALELLAAKVAAVLLEVVT
jgi:hypothetical protein